jgi:tRNA U34 5-methylaminomethyl-2-thiouridine-forming methyltransferase MnmC
MSILVSNDGSHTVFSQQFGFAYHSHFGAVTESAHVFIMAGLRYKAAVQKRIRVLEAGFGTGLNAWMTCLEAEKRNLEVEYVGLEQYPISTDMAAELNYPNILQVPERREEFLRLHQADWGCKYDFSSAFSFSKWQHSIETFEAIDTFDLIYFDAFAPQAQPELWSEEVMTRMYRSLRSEGVLVTYCAQGEFKRALKKAGFLVERLQGPPGKREMTRGVK